MIGPRFKAEPGQRDGWIVFDNAESWGFVEPLFEGTKAECKAVAEALLKVNGYERPEPDNAGSETLTLAKLSQKEECKEVYSLLLELIDAVVERGEADEVARRLVVQLHLGTVCPRCSSVWLGNDGSEQCEFCEEELGYDEEREAA